MVLLGIYENVQGTGTRDQSFEAFVVEEKSGHIPGGTMQLCVGDA